MPSKLTYYRYLIYYFWKLMMESCGNFFRNFFVGFPKAQLPDDLSGKVVLITGANRGLGLETSKVFIQLGAYVIMGVRNVKNAQKVLSEIKDLPEDFEKKLAIIELDLSSFESIHRFANQVNQSFKKIDFLINNAGIMMCPEGKTTDGFELQIGINYFGPFLLTNLLIDKLKASESARIINLSSVAHLAGFIYFDNINLVGCYGPLKAYCQSKLCTILFTRELAKKLSNFNITVYAVHPGLIATDLYSTSKNLLVKLVVGCFGRFTFISPNQGIQTTLFCAFEPELINESGFYYANCRKVQKMIKQVNDNDAYSLWNLSLELCQLN